MSDKSLTQLSTLDCESATTNMFKKKANLPPRPKAPTVEQLLEDLINAPHDDVVFSQLHGPTPAEDSTDLEAVFVRVKSFMAANSQLRNLVHKLETQTAGLQAGDLELQAMAQEIRRQAQDALK
uniref:Uncharacterized protein n=1 Tax=Timema genevievae TaxID=629358 RepID=A0A7R9PQ51_TIMGE|nr:unnamed protein product [Timema genevievae]